MTQQDLGEVVTLEQLNDLVRRVSDLYAQRFQIDRDPAWYLGKLSEELGGGQRGLSEVRGAGAGHWRAW
ncbi:hypothetical protein [Pseudophaeobacter sp.]|uniref:hypothetical protein n=1 Tax=Pseudophaeobacter sp. TaxID=1971739 RepID=UPI003297D33A